MAKAEEDGAGRVSLERSPSHLLHRALQHALDIYGEEVGDGAVTQRQFAVLVAVDADEGLTQTDLVRATGIDRSTLADMAARMIARGLLARERSPTDARANTVRLTPAGRAALAEAGPRVAAADARILALLPGGKARDAFLNTLGALSAAAEAGEAAAPSPVGEAEPPAKKRKADKPPKAEKKKKKKQRKLNHEDTKDTKKIG